MLNFHFGRKYHFVILKNGILACLLHVVSTYQSELNGYEPLVGMHPGASASMTCFLQGNGDAKKWMHRGASLH